MNHTVQPNDTNELPLFPIDEGHEVDDIPDFEQDEADLAHADWIENPPESTIKPAQPPLQAVNKRTEQHASSEKLLKMDQRIYEQLATFLAAEDIEKHRLIAESRSPERQLEYYRFVAQHQVHPDDFSMLVVHSLGIQSEIAETIPSKIEEATAKAAGEVKQAILSGLAPYGAVPREIEEASQGLVQAAGEAKNLAEEILLARKEAIQGLETQIKDSLADFKAELVELGDQMRSQMVQAIEAAGTQALKDMNEASKAKQKEHETLLSSTAKEAEKSLASAVNSMVAEASKLALQIASKAGDDSLAKTLKTIAISMAAGAFLFWLSRH